MEKRKIIYQFDSYQLLKPKDDGNNDSWFNYGKRKSLKAISDIEISGKFDLEMSVKIRNEINEYRIRVGKNRK